MASLLLPACLLLLQETASVQLLTLQHEDYWRPARVATCKLDQGKKTSLQSHDVVQCAMRAALVHWCYLFVFDSGVCNVSDVKVEALKNQGHLNSTTEVWTRFNPEKHGQEEPQEYAGNCHHVSTTETPQEQLPHDCEDVVKVAGVTLSGVYTIYPNKSGDGLNIWCHLEGDRAWTVFLARRPQVPPLAFNRTWQEYKVGFGDPAAEYWLGTEVLHKLTYGEAPRYQLKVYATSIMGVERFGVWDIFMVNNEFSGYNLSVGGYSRSSSLGDALTGGQAYGNISGSQFTTLDVDRDRSENDNCASKWGGDGGWWYNTCFHANPTGPIGDVNENKSTMFWKYFGDSVFKLTGLSSLTMMISRTPV